MHRTVARLIRNGGKMCAGTVVCLGLFLSVTGCSASSIDLTGRAGDLMKINDVTYAAIIQPTVPASKHELSPYDAIRRRRDIVVKNGDAERLEPGTPVYAFDDYAPSFRLAVKQDEELVIYQAQRNPHATKGRDMMDIGGRIQSIGVRLDGDRSETASITDRAQIDAMVEMLLESPYDHGPLMNSGTRQVWLRFHLVDGTDIVNALWLDSGILGTSIQLPEEFTSAIWDTLIAQRETS